MGVKYRVMVIRETETGDEIESERLIELAAPVEMLRQFAPSAVAAALGSTEQDDEDVRDIPAPSVETVERARRRRRTKAEMEAARAAERLADPNSLDEVPDRAAPAPVPAPETSKAYNPFGGNA